MRGGQGVRGRTGAVGCTEGEGGVCVCARGEGVHRRRWMHRG